MRQLIIFVVLLLPTALMAQTDHTGGGFNQANFNRQQQAAQQQQAQQRAQQQPNNKLNR